MTDASQLFYLANAAPMLVTEISYPTYRAPLTSVYNSLWYSGNVMYVVCSNCVCSWF